MRIKANVMRYGAEMWKGTDRWPTWRKFAKRAATRHARREGKKIMGE